MYAVKAQDVSIFSVSEISQALKRAIESQFFDIRVRGEISGLKVHSSGHTYFALRDQDSVLDAVMWRGTRSSSPLQEGLEVIASGKITTYGGRSKYQIVITNIETAGEGALLKLLQEQKLKFQKEGLFDRKRPLPPFPKTIGIITSPTGAVIRDILHRLQDRFPCQVLVWPVAVQGSGSAQEIATAIQGFNTFPHKPDILIVARGGGSLEDLWSFNEEVVVRATAQSAIPIISAVGHETDITLIDFAADKRAPTPTAAAEFATPDQQHLKIQLAESGIKIQRTLNQILERYQLTLTSANNRIPNLPSIILEKGQRLDDWSERLLQAFQNVYLQKKSLLTSLHMPALQEQIIKTEKALESVATLFLHGFKTYFQEKEQHLKWQHMLLSQNSYQRTLEKGFCLVEGSDGLITSSNQFKKAKQGTLRFVDDSVDIYTK